MSNHQCVRTSTDLHQNASHARLCIPRPKIGPNNVTLPRLSSSRHRISPRRAVGVSTGCAQSDSRGRVTNQPPPFLALENSCTQPVMIAEGEGMQLFLGGARCSF